MRDQSTRDGTRRAQSREQKAGHGRHYSTLHALCSMLLIVSCALCLVPIISIGVHAEPVLNYAAPTQLPGVTRQMKTAGFWAARHPAPDALMMNAVQLAAFNKDLVSDGAITDLTLAPVTLDGLKIKEEIAVIIRDLKKRSLFESSDREAGANFYKRVEEEAGADLIPSVVTTRFGFIIEPADERLLPTRDPLYATPGDVDFDEVQNSGLDIGTPVIVMHKSRSGQWVFVRDAIASGWIEADKVAFATRSEVVANIQARQRLVVVALRTDIFLDQTMQEYETSVRMGSWFTVRSSAGRAVEIALPVRTSNGALEFISGFIPRADVNFGALPYTARNVYAQAFRLLDAPYGWGDMNGGQDCSRFLQMVFSTVGIHLPRNSAEQGKVGAMITSFAEGLSSDEKSFAIVNHALGALTILRLKGHIMLYLGDVDGRPFVIHATWAYREPLPEGDRVRVMGRVVVSSLDLGAGSKKGSLLERILSARLIQ